MSTRHLPRLLPQALLAATLVGGTLALIPTAPRATPHPPPPNTAPPIAIHPRSVALLADDSDTADLVPVSATPPVYSIEMHLHGSLSEGDAAMTWATNQAITNHIDVLWWSDHDVLYYPEGSPSVDGYDFESGSLSAPFIGWPSTLTVPVTWVDHIESNVTRTHTYTVRADAAHSGSYGARLEATAHFDGVEERATWYISTAPMARFQLKPLLGDVSLDFWMRPITTSTSGEFQVVVPLSATVSGDDFALDDNYRSIIFYHGATAHPAVSDDGQTLWIPIAASTNAWTEVSANLTDIAVAAWGDAGRDLHAEMITVRAVMSTSAQIVYDVDDFSWSMAITGDDLKVEQESYLSTLGSNPIQLTGIEVSPLDEGHFNVFGSDVPLLPYSTSDTWDAASMTDWVHLYGGLVSLNHMFGTKMIRGTEESRAAEVDSLITTLTANDVWGVDLIEVGYRQRDGVLQDFLEIWDALGMAGLYKTGIGATDLHDELDFATFLNNFVTYVPVTSFSEENVITELRKGNCWFGDPTLFPSGDVTATLTAATRPRAVAGNVVVGQRRPVTVTYTVSHASVGNYLRLIENGLVTSTTYVAWPGGQSVSATINPVGGNVVRFELLGSGGGPMVYSNPIYFVDTDDGNIPADRRLVAR